MADKRTMAKQAEVLYKSSKFTKEECMKLLSEFYTIVGKLPSSKMDRTTFQDVMQRLMPGHFTDILLDRVFRVFDVDNDNEISKEEWIHGMSIFLRGSFDDKTKFCFNVYDLNSDGFISREEMFHLLKLTLVKQSSDEDPDEGVRDLVEVTMKKVDLDHDNRVSYDDYMTTCKEDTLIMEILGPCLPTDNHVTKITESMLVD